MDLAGLSPVLKDAVDRYLQTGIPAFSDDFRTFKKAFRCNADYPAAGTLRAEFFTDLSLNGFTSNFQRLANNEAFVIDRIGFEFEPGLVWNTGAYASTPTAYISSALAAALPASASLTDAEAHRRILNNGRLQFKTAASDLYIVDVFGLKFFPMGCGADMAVSSATVGTAAAGTYGGTAVANVNNGAAFTGNGFYLETRQVIRPNDTVEAVVSFAQLIPVAAQSTMRLHLFGQYFKAVRTS